MVGSRDSLWRVSTPVCADALHAEIKDALVRSLRLPMAAEEIGDSTPLFGADGLGLDSIDVLELVLELERSFGVTIENRRPACRSCDRSIPSPPSSRPSGPRCKNASMNAAAESATELTAVNL